MKGRKIYFTKLDELRFFAFFLVFWQHAYNKSLSVLLNDGPYQWITERLYTLGAVGVHVFFVISGFLITYLLTQEEQAKGKINLSFFYIRRTLRIWPLYFFVMLLGIFAFPYLLNTVTFDGSILKNLLFLNNFDVGSGSFIVSIAWSVAIEEQFYVFWPLLFILFKDKKALLAISFLLFVLSTWFILSYPVLSRFHTLGNINYLMIGCIGGVAYGHFGFRLSTSVFSLRRGRLMLLPFVSGLLIFLAPVNWYCYIISLLFLPLSFLYMVIYLVEYKSSGPSLLSNLGRYTYGMYLYHPMVILFVKIVFDLLGWNYKQSSLFSFGMASVSLVVTILISYISYEYFEKQILKFKNKFSVIVTRV